MEAKNIVIGILLVIVIMALAKYADIFAILPSVNPNFYSPLGGLGISLAVLLFWIIGE